MEIHNGSESGEGYLSTFCFVLNLKKTKLLYPKSVVLRVFYAF